MSMEVVIVVKGGMVREVFSKGGEVSVEVLDLDCPAFVTEEERYDFDSKEQMVEEMRKSPDWTSEW